MSAPRILPAVLAATLLLCANVAQGRPGQTPEITARQADLGELRSRIDGLRKELSTSEGERSDAADRLRESEKQISRLQRELHELDQQQSQLHARLDSLERQSRELGSTLGQQQAQLEKLLYRQYLEGTPDALQLLLNGGDPNQMARDLHYLSAIAQSRAELMGEINATLAQKKRLAADARARTEELAQVEAEQKKRHAELEKQRQERKTLHAELSNKVKAQRREIGNLQRDEKRMTQLIDRLSRILAQQAAAARAAETERRRQQAAESQQAASAGKRDDKPAPPPQTGGPENRYEPVPSDGRFARQQGKLRLPVRGTISGRYGRPRDGGGTWRGLFIRAGDGAPVKAIANGRVVFSDWMRGFGNLLIVDHGDAYLSIYGNNDSLLKQVGQAVAGGETVATVGNTGGNPESGLYFEIRHKGQPIDPLKWASLQ